MRARIHGVVLVSSLLIGASFANAQVPPGAKVVGVGCRINGRIVYFD